MNKKLRTTLCLSACILIIASYCYAVTRDNIVMKCEQAAKLIQTSGLKAAIKAIEDVDGEFVWNNKVNYVFVIDTTGRTLGHPFRPQDKELPGDTMRKITDKNGKHFFEDFIRVANSQLGMGWVNYLWPLPGKSEPLVKSTFVYRVPETNVFVASGMYVIKPGEYY